LSGGEFVIKSPHAPRPFGPIGEAVHVTKERRRRLIGGGTIGEALASHLESAGPHAGMGIRAKQVMGCLEQKAGQVTTMDCLDGGQERIEDAILC
jgi:hypothetical protein